MMPADDGRGSEAADAVYEEVRDFVTRRHDGSLRPLRLTDVSISEFSTELANHLSVVNGGGSIAFARGEELTSVRLSNSAEKLFGAAPTMKKGPQLSWTTIILAAGPHFKGPSQLTIGESVVQLSEDDLALLRSGGPWRFLDPWPRQDDCRKELESSALVLEELVDARRQVQKLSEQISEVEQRLKHHSAVVARLSENQQPGPPQFELLGSEGARGNLPNHGDLDTGAPTRDEVPSHPGPPHLTYIHNGQATRPIPNDPAVPPSDALARNGVTPQPVNVTIRMTRLHGDDFIQALSEILDDEKESTMTWSEDGRSFFIAESGLREHLCERLQVKDYERLKRRLYYFGFHKPRESGWQHKHDEFVRGKTSSIGPAGRSPSLRSPLLHSKRKESPGPRVKFFKERKLGS